MSLLTNGTYSVYAQYARTVGGLVTSNTANNVKIDNSTITPTLTSPASNTTLSSPLQISLTLAESYSAGSARMTFRNTAGTYSNTLTLINGSLSQTFTITTGNISSTNITSKTYSSLPDDTYNVTLSYRDIYGQLALQQEALL